MKQNKYRYLYVLQGHYGYGWEDLTASEDYKEIKQNLKDYRENVDIDYSKPKATGHVIGFQEAQDFYSFIRELNEELSTINFGDKFSELYDAVVNGEVTKVEFLKAIV